LKFSHKLVIATSNKGKLHEFKKMLKPLAIEILSLEDFPEIDEIEENGETFTANALIKARAVANATGLISLADDSGLEVDFLERLPGVHSARFAGEHKDDKANNCKLLSLLEGVEPAKRTAQFKCVIAIIDLDGREYISEGSCEGLILNEVKGRAGFGYDPLFYVPQYQKTFAELDMETKNKISHRGIAIEKAIKILYKIFDVSR